jgi:hypothetical protein
MCFNAIDLCREVWVVMPLMDRGTIAAAVRAGAFEAADGSIHAVSCHAPGHCCWDLLVGHNRHPAVLLAELRVESTGVTTSWRSDPRPKWAALTLRRGWR